jgi:hypothetical protein
MNQTAKTAYLDSWDEIVGEFQGISSDDEFIYMKIGDRVLSFLKDTVEAQYALERLDTCLPGQRIGILRTDISETPILIRLVARVNPSG